jgi:hypothetical protein
MGERQADDAAACEEAAEGRLFSCPSTFAAEGAASLSTQADQSMATSVNGESINGEIRRWRDMRRRKMSAEAHDPAASPLTRTADKKRALYLRMDSLW